MDHPIITKRQNLVLVNKKTTCQIVESAVQTGCRVTTKGVKMNKFLDLARVLRKLWDMKVIIIPVVLRERGTFMKSLRNEQ